MKKIFPFKESVISRGVFALLWIGILGLWQSPMAWSSSRWDHIYELETIGFLKPWDNVDGLFAEYVGAVYKEYFSHQSRFILNDLSKTDFILSQSKLPYRKVIQDPEILGQLVRTTHTESLLRTQIIKEGHQYSFTIDWLHSPLMDQLATIQFSIDEPTEGSGLELDFMSAPLKMQLNQLFEQVPFYGTVTGRDQQELTVDLGAAHTLDKDNILIIGTIEDVRKHPQLNKIVDWKLIQTGKAKVSQVDENMAFGKIIEEEPGQRISRLQKILRIEKPVLLAGGKNKNLETQDSPAHSPETSQLRPRLGWVSASFGAGNSNWQFSLPSSSVSNLGGGMSLNSNVGGELWVTKDWFIDLSFGYSFWSFSQQDAGSGTLSAASQNGGVPGSLFKASFNFGYSYLVTGDFFGPKGWVKLGYKSNDYNLPSSTTEWTGPTIFNSVFLGIGGNVPIRRNWGAQVDFNYRVFSLVTQSWTGGSVTGSSDFQLQVAGYYRMNPRMSILAEFGFQANGAQFSNGASFNQNIMTFGPTFLYYF